jgi:hypothetical protein
MPRYRLPYIILPIAALIAILPLIIRGCSCGHDFDFHIVNWFEVARDFTHGNLHPQWASTPAWNAGEPRFVFYPPISWTTGALLGLFMPWTWTPIAYIWIALTAAGLALFHAARHFAPRNAALIAATIYIVNPYTLYTAYERAAYAELLAAAWIPLLLLAILRDRITVTGIAIPVTLLWLTNAPAAVMSCYALALLTAIRFVRSRSEERTRIALNTVAGTALGLGLASFYLIPAAYERRYVQIAFAILPGISPRENFLFHHTSDPDHDGVLRTASIVAVLLILLTAIALLLLQRRQTTDSATAPRNLKLPLSILALVIAFMLTPLSSPLWMHLPELRFLQFPWRLLAILAPVFALALAQALSRWTLRPVPAIAALIATLALALPADHAFRQRCYPEDTVAERLAVFRSSNPGTDPTDEYTPKGADNDALATANPGYWTASTATEPPPVPSTPASAPARLDLTSPTPSNLILNLRNYPAWRVTRNNVIVNERLHRPDGLIAIPLPAGASHIEITHITLPDQQLGYLLSALSTLALGALWLRKRGSHRPALRTPASHR